MLTIIMIPFTIPNFGQGSFKISDLSIEEVVQLFQLLAALLSICSMILLGFADDVLGKLFKKLKLGDLFILRP